jgi:hypothetical protein
VSNSKHTTEKEFVDRMIPTDTTIKEGIELLGGRTMLFHVAFCTCNKLNRLTKSMGFTRRKVDSVFYGSVGISCEENASGARFEESATTTRPYDL